MTGDEILFSALEEKDLKMFIEMGGAKRYIVSGVSTVAFQREHVAPITLTDLKYVPRLKKNLVSVTMLEEKGYDVVFIKGKAFLTHIATGQTKRIWIWLNHLYKLEVDDCTKLSKKSELVQSQDIGELWRRQLGHLHHGALKIMQQISTGLPKGKLEQVDRCKGCTLGKYTNSSFHDRDSRAEKKDQTFTNFCEFKSLFKKELGKKIKALRSDNGGEYVSQEFKEFCATKGIKRELTAPHNPEQNGVAKRKNKTFVGATRQMLHDQGLPLHLWDEACNIAVYL
eukprot:PITA_23866